MAKPKIVVHCLVKNEERFIWYAINSVLPFADKVMIWDNGSTDKTVEIIKSIKSPKIEFEEHEATTREAIGLLRQEMIEKTPKGYDWLLVLDADEIWSADSIKKVINHLSSHPTVEAVITRTFNLVGDIYHRLPEKFGDYQFLNMKGNFAVRFINLKIPGLHASCPYGREGYFDNHNLPIQERQDIVFVDTEYFHATHLIRSSKNKEVFDRPGKLKYFLGEENSLDKIPDVFFSPKPPIVPTVINHMNIWQLVRSFIETILRNIKNILFNK
ncbi:MAG TPA: glycosyltransferase family 2 protein [Candidatus Woesebacteria bacterium]|mgnify:CR=1 FL=1|nr:glycosyltransferase family 2 protein [Candidatus Woesebacteria bacterium]